MAGRQTVTAAIAQSISVEHHVLTVPVSTEVSVAIAEWGQRHLDDLIATLEPFGLHPYDIAAPRYERIVTRADIDPQ